MKTSSLSFSKLEMHQGKASIQGAGMSFPFTGSEHFSGIAKKYQLSNFDIASPEDYIPKDEDFVKVPFRLISATIVGADTWKATDFTDAAVLKASTGKLVNKPVYLDHDLYSVTKNVGKIFTTGWQESYVNKDGVKVPAGINGLIGVDAKTNLKIARDIASGSIYSDSVTVWFNWVPSHEFGSPDDFERNIGNVIDGRMVCRKVVEILDYYETSLVFLGADPYAKKIDANGDLVNIDVASTFEDEKRAYTKEKSYNVLNYQKDTINLCSIDNHFFESLEKNNMKDILDALVIKLGLKKPEELTVQHIEDNFNKSTDPDTENLLNFAKRVLPKTQDVDIDKALEFYSAFAGHTNVLKGLDFANVTEGTHRLVAEQDYTSNLAKVSNLTSQVATLESQLSKEIELAKELTHKLTEQTTLADLGKATIETKREETIRLYKLSAGEGYDETVVDLFKSATPTQLDGLLKQYVQAATSKFTATCKSCGEHEFSFRSSLVVDKQEDNTAQAPKLTLEALHEKFSRNQK